MSRAVSVLILTALMIAGTPAWSGTGRVNGGVYDAAAKAAALARLATARATLAQAQSGLSAANAKLRAAQAALSQADAMIAQAQDKRANIYENLETLHKYQDEVQKAKAVLDGGLSATLNPSATTNLIFPDGTQRVMPPAEQSGLIVALRDARESMKRAQDPAYAQQNAAELQKAYEAEARAMQAYQDSQTAVVYDVQTGGVRADLAARQAAKQNLDIAQGAVINLIQDSPEMLQKRAAVAAAQLEAQIATAKQAYLDAQARYQAELDRLEAIHAQKVAQADQAVAEAVSARVAAAAQVAAAQADVTAAQAQVSAAQAAVTRAQAEVDAMNGDDAK